MTEWNASARDQESSLQQAMAEEELGRLKLKGDGRILDVDPAMKKSRRRSREGCRVVRCSALIPRKT